MFTQTVEYALRAMVCLANAEAMAQTRTQLVEQTKVPSAYLAKVMREMNRSGLVNAQRGVNGGFTLAKPATEITLLEVVSAVDPLPQDSQLPAESSQPRNAALRLAQVFGRFDGGLGTVARQQNPGGTGRRKNRQHPVV